MNASRLYGLVVLLLASACASSSGGGSSQTADVKATLADFCDKCAACVAQPGFSEGFCTPHKLTNGGFDRLGCTQKGDTTQLANQNVTEAQLNAFTCQQFDDAE